MRALVVLDERWNSALTDLGIKLGQLLECEVAFGVLKGYPAHRRLEGKFTLFFVEDPRKGLPFKAFLSLKRALEAYKPQILVTIRGEELLFGALLKKRFGYRLFRVHGHQRGVKDSFLNRLLHERFVDGVVVANRDFLKSSALGSFKERSLVIPGAVDTSAFYYDEEGARRVRNSLKIGRKRLIGVLGRFDPVKGHELLFKALSLLKRSDYHLLVIGREEGISLSQLEKLSEKLGLRRRVTFVTELLSPSQLRSYLSACELGVVPSLGSEVLLRAPLEFMACRSAVVSTSVGSLKFVVKEPFGLCVRPEPEELAAAIDLMLSRNLKELGKRAQEEVNEKYSLYSLKPAVNSFFCGRL